MPCPSRHAQHDTVVETVHLSVCQERMDCSALRARWWRPASMRSRATRMPRQTSQRRTRSRRSGRSPCRTRQAGGSGSSAGFRGSWCICRWRSRPWEGAVCLSVGGGPELGKAPSRREELWEFGNGQPPRLETSHQHDVLVSCVSVCLSVAAATLSRIFRPLVPARWLWSPVECLRHLGTLQGTSPALDRI
jgi:hypothetical protein